MTDPTTDTPAVEPPTDQAGLRDRIADVLAAADGWTWAPDFDRTLSPAYQGYQKQADAVLAVLPTTDPAAVCICGHPEERHFEDVCQTCGCGDYLEPRDAAEVIDRWRQSALKARDGERAAVLRWAADQIDAETWQAKTDGVLEPDKYRPCRDASAQLRALAAELRQQPTDEDVVEAHRIALSFALHDGAEAQQPAHACGNCEGIDPNTCLTNPDRPAPATPQPAPVSAADAAEALAARLRADGWHDRAQGAQDVADLLRATDRQEPRP